MKIYRLLEIIIYLLNNKFVTAKQLAMKFECSVRTIQRDMETLLIIGVPVESTVGINGGYSISDSFKLQNQFVKKEDLTLIITALKSLITGYNNTQLEKILDTYESIVDKESHANISLDYSVVKEDKKVQALNQQIEVAIINHHQISFDYYNIENFYSSKNVIPVILRFQWYAWYLFAYDLEKDQYRTYKVSRIDNVIETDVNYVPYTSDGIEQLLEKNDSQYRSTYECIIVKCKKEGIHILKEYFPEEHKEKLPDGNFLMYLRVPEKERLWQALLLSMGNYIEIISPEYYKQKLIETAKNFLSNYDI